VCETNSLPGPLPHGRGSERWVLPGRARKQADSGPEGTAAGIEIRYV
jgi:hypothetical protein